MTESIYERLSALGIELRSSKGKVGNYVPYVKSGNTLYISGQLPMIDGEVSIRGTIGNGVSSDTGREAARLCAINILAQAQTALGSLTSIRRILKLTVFVASDPKFTDQHLIANEASDLLAAALGDLGKHARSAVGVAALPLNATVEIDAVMEIF